jgi:hypothetical protein
MKRNVTEITTSGPNHGQTFQNVSSKGLLLTSIPNIVNRNRDRDRDRDRNSLSVLSVCAELADLLTYH